MPFQNNVKIAIVFVHKWRGGTGDFLCGIQLILQLAQHMKGAFNIWAWKNWAAYSYHCLGRIQ